MSVETIRAALENSIHAGEIDLVAAARQHMALGSLLSLANRLRLGNSFPVTAAVIATGTSLRLTGVSTFGIEGSSRRQPVSVTLSVVAASQDSEEFELTLAFLDPLWTFGSLFGSLGTTYKADDAGLDEVPSLFADLRLSHPALSARSSDESVHFNGGLLPSGELAAYEPLFGPWPLQLSGLVVLPPSFDEPPAFVLSAPSPLTSFVLGSVSLTKFLLELESINDRDPVEWLNAAETTAAITATLTVGSFSAEVTTPLFSMADYWRMRVVFPDGLIQAGAVFGDLCTLLGVSAPDLPSPPLFPALSNLFLHSISLSFDRAEGSVLPATLEVIDVTLASNVDWIPPIPFVRIRGASIRWTMSLEPDDAESAPALFASIAGTLVSERFDIDVEAFLPSFEVIGRLADNDVVPLEGMLRQFFGTGSPPPDGGMALTDLAIFADPEAQTYRAEGTVLLNGNSGWTVDLGVVTLNLRQLVFEVSAMSGNTAGTLVADLTITAGSNIALFQIAAAYPGRAIVDGRTFRGSMVRGSQLSLFTLVERFLGITPSPDLPDIILRDLTIEFTTGTKRYALEGVIDGRWAPTIFGENVKISAEARVSVVREPNQRPTGTLLGDFLVNKVRVKVGVTLGGQSKPTYLFELQFGDNFVKAVTAWKGDHQVLSVRLGGVTIGEILTFLANLAAPTLGFKLDPPWDQLNNIKLDNFLFTVDPKEKSVGVTYDAPIELAGVMKIESVGFVYRKRLGKPVVDVQLTGRLGTKQYTSDKPLTWDAVSDPPPSIGGGGSKLLDIRYLGFGQRVTRAGGFTSNSVRGTLDQLANDLRPPKNPNLPPIFPGNGGDAIRYAPESEWLIGFDLTLLNTVSLGVIFNDPYIYGLAIGLQGERAKALKGLKFEILYKKVTNDIGVYRVELQLPEAYRQIEVGAVTITLGAVAVEIFTNGDFSVDLGFPWNRNFARSFTVQVFPFLGRGGLYFKKLSGETSSRVPSISNGTFAPVLEFGIGLSVGVGKEVSRGPLSGGVSVQIEVILNGVIAWFHPASSGTPPAEYYRIEGTVGIRGKLYGVLDFEIIRISVVVEAYASATVVFESYRSTLFQLSAGVTVYAEVDILDLFTISFSFNEQIDASFVVGSDQPTPWILGSPSPTLSLESGLRIAAAPPAALRHAPMSPVPHRRERALRETKAARAQRDVRSFAAAAAEEVSWNPSLAVFPGPRTIALKMLPLFSIANVPFAWDGTTPVNAAPDYRAAFLLLAPNAGGASSARNTLIEAMLRWSLSAASTQSFVTIDELATLASRMKSADTRAAFSTANLATFFGTNAPIEVSGAPETAPADPTAMAFPIPPTLAWTAAGADRDFASFNAVGPLYQWGIRRYLARFLPDAAPAGPEPADEPSSYESFASYVFRDFCLMVAASAVQAAQDAMRSWTVTLTAAASPADAAAVFPSVNVSYSVRAGDTLDSVAGELGATPAELVHLNPDLIDRLALAEPGTVIDIALGVSPQAVGVDNAEVALATGVTFGIGTVDVRVSDEDNTLAEIATRFGLPNAAALLNGGLAFDADVLRDGSTFNAPAATYESATFSRTRAAAVFFVHYTAPTDIPMSDWYAQTVADLNPAVLQQAGATLPPGLELSVPVAFEDPTPDALRYVTVPGDTLPRIGAALALEQNFATGDGPTAAWTAFRGGVTGTAPVFTIPAAKVVVLPRESLADLAGRLIVFSGDVAALVTAVRNADILTPLAVIHVPDVQATVGAVAEGSPADGTTLDAIASRFGIAVAELAARVPASTKILPAGATLTISHLLVQNVEQLVTRVMTGLAPDQISGSCSRFLMAGLRLPAPVETDGHAAATGSLTALYDLTGQQIPRPAADTTVTITSNAPWVTVSGGSLAFTYTQEQLDGFAPAAALALPVPKQALMPMQLSRTSPRTYGLERRVNLQSSQPLPLFSSSTVRTGTATLWPFDAELLDLARSGRGIDENDESHDATYDIIATRQGRQTNVAGALFATLVPFSVRRVAEAAGVYEMSGVRTEWRQDLLELWRSIEDGIQAFVWLTGPPSRASADPSGLAVLPYASGATFIVKTNLSGGVSTNAVPVGGADPMSNPRDFLRTLWEASVVGGAGYSLVLPAGQELPSAVFATTGDAALQLLVVLTKTQGGGGHGGGQNRTAKDGLPLRTYHNCVFVQRGGVDPSTTSLFIEAEKKPETVTTALVPPGTVGFTFTINRGPVAGDQTAATADTRLRQLFSLATWDVAGEADAPGLPVPPAATDDPTLTVEDRVRNKRWKDAGRDVPVPGPLNYWRYDQVLPVSRFAVASVVPDVPGLPPAGLDPYRGIGGGPLQSTTFQVGFSDVLGNVTDPASSKSVTVPLGYTDPLVSIAGWPSTTASYLVSGAGNPTLSVTIAPQPGALLPSPKDAPAAIRDNALKQAGAWASIHYQLWQPGVTVTIRSTLRSDAVHDVQPLRRFAAASYAATHTAAALQPVFADGTLAATVSAYGVTYEALATANAGARMSGIFTSEPIVPAYAIFSDGETADEIAAAERPGWPAVAGGAALLQLPENADELPLRPNAVLRTNERTFSIEGGSLANTAALHRTTPALLAQDNAQANNILRLGAVLVYDEVEVIVGETATPGGGLVGTLSDAIDVFASVGVAVTAADLGFSHANDDLLRPSAILRSTHFVAADGETLADVAAAAQTTVAELATMNATAENLYDAGALLFLGFFDAAFVTIDPLESLQAFANRYATPAGALLAANAERTLAGDTLVIPGAVKLPDDVSTLAVPYTIRTGDTLESIAEKFGTTAQALSGANANMPGAIANDQPVPGALMIVPPPFIAGSNPRTLADIAAQYGVGKAAFAQANSALLGVLAAGVPLTIRGISLQTTATDTFNSLTTRLEALGVGVDVDRLAEELSEAACIAAGARALLPPAPAKLTVSVGSLPIFDPPVKPLEVTVRLARPAAVIHPHFPTTGPVAMAEAVIPAPSLKEEDSLALHAFADAFEAALPNLRLATGKVSGVASDLWFVDFSTQGIQSVVITPPAIPRNGQAAIPRFLSFRPLYRELVARSAVSISSLDENGALVDPVDTDFQNVDVEVWAQRFLSGMDLFLTAPYVAAMTRNAATRASLEAVIDAKTKLVKAIPSALGPTLAGSAVTDPGLANGVERAMAELQEQLGTSLASAYSIAAVVQYEAAVQIEPPQSPLPGGRDSERLPMRLGGTAAIVPRTDPHDTPYTLAGAKTALNAERTNHVTFFLRVPQAKLDRAVTIDFSYDILELEFNIDDVPKTRGYQSSDFVVFPRPLDAARRPAALRPRIGRTTVPIPLRNFPMPPTFLGHTGLPAFKGRTPAPEEASRWTYSLSYAHEHAAQDEVIVTATFNIPPASVAELRVAEEIDLASLLAQYNAIADPLWSLLSESIKDTGAVPVAAAATFAQLAGTIASAWSTHPIGATTEELAATALASSGPVLETYTYRVRINVAFGEGGVAYYDTVELRINGGVGPDGRWPSVIYESEDGVRIPLLSLGNGLYEFPHAVDERQPIAALPRITLEWTSLPLTHYQNAEGSLFVQRNAELLPGLATAPDLVYTTAKVTAPDIITPLLIWTDTILFGSDALTIEDALRNLFTGLFGSSLDIPLTIEALYGYELVAGSELDEGIVIDAPVTLYPNQLLSTETPAALATALREWSEETHPVADGARWAFSLTMFSQLDPVTARPLLIINRLVSTVGVEVVA